MLRSCDGLRLHYAEKDAIIFFCAPLLRQLPLRSLLCLSLLCTDAKAAQLGSSSCASLALRLHDATAIPSDCSEN